MFVQKFAFLNGWVLWQVDQGQVAQLGHLSLVEVGGVRLLFMINHAAAKRATARTLQLRA